MDTSPVLKMSRDEILRCIDAEAQRRLGMSGPAMLSAYRAGLLKNYGSVADVIVLANLLADDDPVFVAP